MTTRPDHATRSAIGLLRVLLAASVLLPGLAVVGVCWLDYRTTMADAEGELRHTSEVAREHAARLFDSQIQVADRINDLVRGMDAPTITAAQQSLHDQFAWIVARLPQVQSVLLADRDGRPLVSAGTYPVPTDIRLSDRDYFQAVVERREGIFVSSVQFGAVNRQLFFGISRPWLAADGTVLGVVDVAVLPGFFRDFYRVLADENGGGTTGKVISLVRDDGEILARFPPLEGSGAPAPKSSAFAAALRAQPEQGMYESRSVIDPRGPIQLASYRKVEGYKVYVIAARARKNILAPWRADVWSDLAVAIPVMLALFAVSWTALVRTRREADALARAREEMARREQAEAALLAAQRLEAVGRMTGGVAHDFNNLLTMILGGAEALQRRPDDPARVRRIADQLVHVARRGGEVTQQLLTFARRQPVNPQVLDLNRQLQAFKPLLEHAAHAAIPIELELEAELAPVRVDAGQFEAAILNLVGNARDAMPKGGRIVIATRNRMISASDSDGLPAGRYVRVTLRDTGSGMDEQTAARAFEPFFTTKDVGSGTGLGLSQVFGFARQAGGDARIISAPGRGTTVELLLPAVAAPLPAAVPRPRPADTSARGHQVVLVVDDEPGVLELAAEHLRDLGYAALTATNGEAALARLRGPEQIDVLMSDVVMPGGMDGMRLSVEAARLRPELKVLLTSGYVGSAETDMPDGFPLLLKPYDRAQLAASLHGLLHG